MRFLLGLLNFRIVLKHLTLKFTRNLEKTFKTEVLLAYFSNKSFDVCAISIFLTLENTFCIVSTLPKLIATDPWGVSV